MRPSLLSRPWREAQPLQSVFSCSAVRLQPSLNIGHTNFGVLAHLCMFDVLLQCIVKKLFPDLDMCVCARTSGGNVVFDLYSNGLKTNCDFWLYNSSKIRLENKLLTIQFRGAFISRYDFNYFTISFSSN